MATSASASSSAPIAGSASSIVREGSTTATTVVDNGGVPELSASPGRLDPTNAAFNTSRKPLAGEFLFNGDRLFVIANHFNSKVAISLFGHFQPPTLISEIQRNQQAQIVNNFVDAILAVDSSAKIAVVGDLNDFEFSNPLNTLKGGVLNALIETLPQAERYTYVFEGTRSRSTTFCSATVFDQPFAYDVVHVNTEFAAQASDHEPQVVELDANALPPQSWSPASASRATRRAARSTSRCPIRTVTRPR